MSLLFQAGKSVLFYAIAKRNLEAVEMLIAAKANIAVTDSVSAFPTPTLPLPPNMWFI
jgi:ankyrin repeat protein